MIYGSKNYMWSITDTNSNKEGIIKIMKVEFSG